MKTIPTRVSVMAAVSALLMVGVGCVPVFRHALPLPETLIPDAALVGSWTAAGPDADDTRALFFARRDGWLDIVYAQGGDRLSLTRYEGFTTRVNAESILCFRGHTDGAADASGDGYLLAQYRVESSRELHLRLFAQAPVRALVEAGRLAGTVQTNGQSVAITVTATPAELLAVLQAEGVEAFAGTGDAMVFARLEAAVP